MRGLNIIDHIVFKVLKISRNERNKEILRKGVMKESSIRATLRKLKNLHIDRLKGNGSSTYDDNVSWLSF